MSFENSRLLSKFFVVAASHLALAYMCEANAQTSPATTTPAGAPTASYGSSESNLDELVVTAQRRSESLKDVPISVQAVTGDQISRQAITDTRDLASIAPTLNFTTGNNGGATAFSLRGISSVSLESGVQPSTAMVIDGVPVVRQSEFVADLGDIDRVEILNGPQGTLFGKNSTAGVINITTKRPGGNFEGSIEGLATNDSEYSVRVMLNTPITDGIRLRLDGYYRDQQPLIKNLSGPDIIGVRSYGFRGKADFDITQDADFLLQANYSHGDSSYGQLIPVRPSVFSAAQLALIGVPVGFGATTINMNSPAEDITENKSVTGTFSWRPTDHLTIVSISNYTRFDEHSVVDEDGTPAGANIGTGALLPNSTYPVQSIDVGTDSYVNTYSYYSEELRANYASGPFNTVVGAYYQRVNQTSRLRTPFNFDGFVLGLTPGVRYFESPEFNAQIPDKTASVFGDLTYEVVSHIKVFGGVRYTYEDLSERYHRDDYLNLYSFYNPITTVNSAPPVDSINVVAAKSIYNTSGRVGAQYQPTSDLNFYVSAARGYKGPAADASQNLSPATYPIIKPELATGFELGAKVRFFDHRVAVNAAAFHETIENIQENINLPGPILNPQLVNAGKLRTYGFEGDAQWAVTPEFHLGAGVVYDRAYYLGYPFVCNSTQLAAGTCPNSPAVGFQNIRGQQAVGSPRWKYSLSADYENQLAATNMRFYSLLRWTWTDSIQYQLGDDPFTREPSHGMLNAALGLKGPGDRWDLELFGKNLTNRFYYSNRLDAPILGQPIAFLSRDFGVYGGVKLSYHF
jgi:iron complex outermembrane receptor protein